jgi:hypothetical protein
MQMQMLTQGSVDRTAEFRHLILKDICNRPLEAGGDIIPLIFHEYILLKSILSPFTLKNKNNGKLLIPL